MQTGSTFCEDKQPLDTCEILAALQTQFHTKTHKTEKKIEKIPEKYKNKTQRYEQRKYNKSVM